jgi:toxin ParE1/3/4
MKPSFRVIINPFAELDLKASVEFFELQQTGLAKQFLKEVENAIKRIELNPQQFPKVYKAVHRALLQKFPFGIYFIINGDLVNIFAVFHFSRNPRRLKKRL